MLDYLVSRFSVLACQGKESFDHALVVYIACLTAGVVLVVFGTLCMFLVLMNAAYKVRRILILKYLFDVDICIDSKKTTNIILICVHQTIKINKRLRYFR